MRRVNTMNTQSYRFEWTLWSQHWQGQTLESWLTSSHFPRIFSLLPYNFCCFQATLNDGIIRLISRSRLSRFHFHRNTAEILEAPWRRCKKIFLEKSAPHRKRKTARHKSLMKIGFCVGFSNTYRGHAEVHITQDNNAYEILKKEGKCNVRFLF